MNSERFRTTPGMDELLREGGLNHGMIKSMVERSLDESTDVEGVPLSRSGDEEHVLRTGSVIIDGQPRGFKVIRKHEPGTSVSIKIIVGSGEPKNLNPKTSKMNNVMTELPKIQEFLKKVESNENYTGSVEEQFFDGDVKIRLSIGKTDDGHRNGSFSFLLKWDGDFEELGKKEIWRVADLNELYEDLEDSFVDLINETLGYNEYEPILDKADAPGEEEYDIVFHDSVIVYD